MKKYRLLGCRGYYGIDFYNKENNKKAEKANRIIDLYNSKINTFETKEENDNFAKEIRKKIRKIFREK